MDLRAISHALQSGLWIKSDLKLSTRFSWIGKILKKIGFYTEYRMQNFRKRVLKEIQTQCLAPSSAAKGVNLNADFYSALKILRYLKQHIPPGQAADPSINTLTTKIISSSSYKHRAQSLIAKNVRRMQTQNRVVLPKQLHSGLTTHLSTSCSSQDIDCIAQSMARNIATLINTKEKELSIHGKQARSFALTVYPKVFISKDGQYTYAADDSDIQSIPCHIPYDCRYTLSNDASIVEVQFIPVDRREHKLYLAEGSFKTIFKAPKFKIPLKLDQGTRTVDFDPNIVMFINEGDPGDITAIKQFLDESLDIQRTVAKRVPNIAPTPIAQGQHYEQDWYNADLSDAISSGIPLSFEDDSPVHLLTFKDKVQIALDIAQALHQMHHLNFVHHDIKTNNILLKIENGQVRAYLTDFDLVGENNHKSYSQLSMHWNILGQIGVAEKTCDNYGLAIAIAELLFYQKEDSEIMERSFYSRCLEGDEALVRSYSSSDKEAPVYREVLDVFKKHHAANKASEDFLFNTKEGSSIRKQLETSDGKGRDQALKQLHQHLNKSDKSFPKLDGLISKLQEYLTSTKG